MAAELLYRRLVSYSGLEAMHGVLSSRERSELFEQTGVCRAVDCRCLTGHYSLDLRLRTHNCAANLLQVIHIYSISPPRPSHTWTTLLPTLHHACILFPLVSPTPRPLKTLNTAC
jgi:hypothetical protein